MQTAYKVYFKFAENGTYTDRPDRWRWGSIEAAMASTHLGDPAEAYADPSEWTESPDGGTWYLADSITSKMGRSSPWLIKRVRVPESDADRIELAVELGFQYGGIDGAHHKQWVIDQMLRTLLGNDYEAKVIEAKAGEDGPDTYGWDEGIAP